MGGQGRGKILQRFPQKDWDNCPFTQGIELVSLNIAVILSPRSGYSWPGVVCSCLCFINDVFDFVCKQVCLLIALREHSYSCRHVGLRIDRQMQ